MGLGNFLRREWASTLNRPSRLFNIFRPARLGSYLKFQKLRMLSRESWSSRNGGLATREVDSYDDYLALQRSKLQYLDLGQHEVRFRSALRERLSRTGVVNASARVLCLGARLGAEVAAFRDAGCFAFGIDLNPGADNPWVLYGDFHHLAYPDSCVDIVYTNSLDHCLEPVRVLREIHRILTAQGSLIIEADPGVRDQDGIAPDMWATFQWESVAALKREVSKQGFSLVAESGFEYPRHGTMLVFRTEIGDSR